jgi:frataxin
MPDAENPQPKDSEPNEEATAAANISYEEYHQLADYYLEELVAKLEEMQETRSDLEVEYAVRRTFSGFLAPRKLCILGT